MRSVSQEQLADLMSPVIWHGRYFTTLCPFHDDSKPSFNVYPDGAVCLAASCGRHVSLSQLYRKVSPLSARQTQPNQSEHRRALIAWESIPDRERLAQQSHDYLLRHPLQAHYLKQRGLEACIRRHELGYWNGWITIPIFDFSHRFQGIVFRATPSMQSATSVRYLTPPDQPKLLYVPDHGLTHLSAYVYVVFGMFDALALSLLGLPVVTCTNIHSVQPSDLDRYRCRLLVIPDKGEDAKGRALVNGLDWRGTLLSLPYGPDLKDCADYVQLGYSQQLSKLLAVS